MGRDRKRFNLKGRQGQRVSKSKTKEISNESKNIAQVFCNISS